jgi:hypothetical protein
MEARNLAPFAERETVIERLKTGPEKTEPDPPAEKATAVTTCHPAANRWTLRSLQRAFPELSGYSPSGVWRALRRLGLKLRSARVQQYSPDPEYAQKVRRLLRCLRAATRDPRRTIVLFLDEMGFCRWPEPARDWSAAAPAARPLADRRHSPNGLWRLVGTLDACSGRVLHADGYIIGRKQLIAFYGQIERAYPRAERIYVVQDNWSVHRHDDVLASLRQRPRITPVWLPTYAPWLNPIEKLWRWLKQDVLYMHRLADDWQALLGSVLTFLNRFAHGSKNLRRYVGLLGHGQLATALNLN